MEWLDGYKAVRKNKWKDNGSFYSATFHPEFHPEVGVEYILEDQTVPRKGCGPLAVFDSLDDAKIFKKIIDKEMIIFECKYKKSEHYTFWRHGLNGSLVYNPKDKDIIKMVVSGLKEVIPRTRFADVIILTKEIA